MEIGQHIIMQVTPSVVILTLMDGTLVHGWYLPNNVGTHLQLSILRQIGVNEIGKGLQNRTIPAVGISNS